MAGSAVFVDTNILVYFVFSHFVEHNAARKRLADCEKQQVALWTSRQVLREFLAVTTRPGFLTPLPPSQFLVRMVETFEKQFRVVGDDAAVTARLLELIDNPGAQGRQVHDANIVATMRCHQLSLLLTHNGSDFGRYAPLVTVIPLIP
jgi:predicted nucleic acid-binding protein